MGYLTDLINKILEFFEITPAEPIMPEKPPKPAIPAEAERPLPTKEPIEPPIEPVEPLPEEPVEAPIGEEGRRRRIEKPPAKTLSPEVVLCKVYGYDPDKPEKKVFFIVEAPPDRDVEIKEEIMSGTMGYQAPRRIFTVRKGVGTGQTRGWPCDRIEVVGECAKNVRYEG